MNGDDFLTVESLWTPLEKMWRHRANQGFESEMMYSIMPPPEVGNCPMEAQGIAAQWETFWWNSMDRGMLRSNMQPYLEKVGKWIEDTYGEASVPKTTTDDWYRSGLSKRCVDSMVEFDDWYSKSKQRADENVEGKQYDRKFEIILDQQL